MRLCKSQKASTAAKRPRWTLRQSRLVGGSGCPHKTGKAETVALKRPRAETDLEEIWFYIDQDSPNNADKLLERIQGSCWALADFSDMGMARRILNPCSFPT